MDIKLVPFADKIAGSGTTTGVVSADDINQIKKTLNSLVTALFDLDSTGMATSGIVKLLSLPDVDLMNYFSSDFVVSGGVITLAAGSAGGGSSMPQLSSPATLTSSAVTDTGITLSWALVTNAGSYILQRSTNTGFSGATTIYSGNNTTFADSALTPGTNYYYRVLATATGYANSAYKSASYSTTGTSSGSGSTGNLTSLTAFDFYDTFSPINDSAGSFKYDTTVGSSDIGFAVKKTIKIPSGGTGFVQVQCLPASTGTSSGWIGLYADTQNYTGNSDSEMSCRRNNSGSIGYRYTGLSEQGTNNGSLANNGYLRIRTDGTSIYLEKSADAVSWSLVTSRAQISHDLYIHCQIYGGAVYNTDQDKVSNIQYSGFVAA